MAVLSLAVVKQAPASMPEPVLFRSGRIADQRVLPDRGVPSAGAVLVQGLIAHGGVLPARGVPVHGGIADDRVAVARLVLPQT